MRRRIKPIVVLVFFLLFALLLIIGKTHSDHLKEKELKIAKSSVPIVSSKEETKPSSTTDTEEFILNPIVDVSGWQLPRDID
ncbi:TPA: hypothetical protein ACNHRS_005737, partial [Escherichia coli]